MIALILVLFCTSVPGISEAKKSSYLSDDQLPIIPVGTIQSQWDDYKETFTLLKFALDQYLNQTDKLYRLDQI